VVRQSHLIAVMGAFLIAVMVVGCGSGPGNIDDERGGEGDAATNEETTSPKGDRPKAQSAQEEPVGFDEEMVSPLGQGNLPAGFGEGSLWATGCDDVKGGGEAACGSETAPPKTLLKRVDPRSGEVVAEITLKPFNDVFTQVAFGAGFGRTGTMSLKVALEELGFGPCYHMSEVFTHPEHVELWRAATREEQVDWEQIFGGYRATVDWPGCTFYKELLERSPNAKVILTVRDPQRWYESAYNTIYRITGAASSPLFYLASLLMLRARRMKQARRMIVELIWEREFHGRFEDREYAIETFERHNEEVTQHVLPEKLLVYEVKEGWAPLCEFLGVEVPDKPFPHLNDSAVFRDRIRRIRALTVATLALCLSLAGLVLLYLRLRKRH
jgi:hypothetical protein